MHLLQLPVEILLEIATELNEAADISRLSRTNTCLQSVLGGFLYKYDAHVRHGGDSGAKGRSIALYWAAKFGKFNVIDKALHAGADIDRALDRCDKAGSSRSLCLYGHTPFHVAVLSGYAATVKYLLRLNVDVNKPSLDGQTPILSAIRARHFEMFREIFDSAGFDPSRSYSVDESPLQLAVCMHNLPVVQYILKSLDKPNAHHYPTDNLHHIATFKGYASIVQCLLASDHVDSGKLLSCDVPGVHNFDRETAFSVACKRGRVEIVKILFNHGVDINTVRVNGMSPLEYALSKYREDVIVFLLADTSGRVAYNIDDVFDWAIFRHSDRVAKVCIEIAAMDGERTRSWCEAAQVNSWSELVDMIRLRHQTYLLHLCE